MTRKEDKREAVTEHSDFQLVRHGMDGMVRHARAGLLRREAKRKQKIEKQAKRRRSKRKSQMKINKVKFSHPPRLRFQVRSRVLPCRGGTHVGAHGSVVDTGGEGRGREQKAQRDESARVNFHRDDIKIFVGNGVKTRRKMKLKPRDENRRGEFRRFELSHFRLG